LEPVTIRSARATDIEELAGLLGQLFLLEADFAVDAAKQGAGLRLLLDRPGAFVAVAETETGGAVVGMCTVQTLISTAEGGPVGLVEDLVVHQAWRGRGVGARLLRAVEEWSARRGLRRLQLLADRENAAALRFYAYRGWRATQLMALKRQQRAVAVPAG
jgi:GNAT superfamily N-acetyltransferase